jgi:molybdopterin-guanine dinucleotide biosynthesis protein A
LIFVSAHFNWSSVSLLSSFAASSGALKKPETAVVELDESRLVNVNTPEELQRVAAT